MNKLITILNIIFSVFWFVIWIMLCPYIHMPVYLWWMLGVGWGKGIFSVIRKLLGRGYAFMKTGVIILILDLLLTWTIRSLKIKKVQPWLNYWKYVFSKVVYSLSSVQAQVTYQRRFIYESRILHLPPKVPTPYVKSVDVLSSRHAVQFDSISLFYLTRRDSLP